MSLALPAPASTGGRGGPDSAGRRLGELLFWWASQPGATAGHSPERAVTGSVAEAGGAQRAPSGGPQEGFMDWTTAHSVKNEHHQETFQL